MAYRGSHNYPDKVKIEVVTTYLALGKIPMVEVVTGVPRSTIKVWKQQPWWKDLENEIRQDDDMELDSRLSKIINRSLDAVVDRLDHGDFILDSRSGQIKRVPVKMRDAERVSTDMIDKRNLIRGKPTNITQKITVEDVMAKLAEEFKKWSTGQVQQEKLIEIEDAADAVYDERETGLRSGVREVSGETGPDQEPGRTE